MMQERLSSSIPVLAAAVALNLVFGTIVQALKLPIYVDAVGTIIAAIALGFWPAIIVGISSSLIAAALVSPVYLYFIGPHVVLATYTYLVARYCTGFRTLPRVIVAGLGLGLVAGLAAAPVIVLVFGGATGSGRDLITAVLVKSGQQMLQAVAMSGMASEPVDKVIQCLLAFSMLRKLPLFVRRKLSNAVLDANFPESR